MLAVVQSGTKANILVKLTLRQEKAIAAILASRTTEDGLRRAQVSKTQWHRWLSDPGFRAAYGQRQRELLEAAFHTLRASLGEAVQTLTDIMTQTDQHPATRLRAALALIDTVMKADLLTDLEDRVEVLEAAASKGGKG